MKRTCGKRLLFFFFFTVLAFAFSACGEKAEEINKIKDLEYTVVEEGNVPEELLAKINEKKLEPFIMTYQSDGYLYIAEGYGTQKSGGYSIRVTKLYEADHGIVFQSELLGPGKDEPVIQMETHPYIVIKLQDIGKELYSWN